MPRYSNGKSSPIKSVEIGEIPGKQLRRRKIIKRQVEFKEFKICIPNENAIVKIKTQSNGIQSLLPFGPLFSS